MTTITALPTPPSRSDPVNFAQRGDEFLGALPQFQAEINQVASEITQIGLDATASSVIAQAAANYKGDYSAGVTYLQGESVTYLGSQYILKVASSTGVLPTNTTNWLRIQNRGFGGQSLGNSNVVLSTDSPGTTRLKPTSFGNSSVTLPSPSTVELGTAVFTIMNDSSKYDIPIYFSSNIVGFVRPKTAVTISASSSTTWDIQNDFYIGVTAGVELGTTALGAAVQYLALTGLSNGTAKVLHLISGSNGLFGIAYDSVNNTWGSLTQIVATSNVTFKAGLTATSNTAGAAFVAYSTGTQLISQVVTVNANNSISVGTAATTNGFSANFERDSSILTLSSAGTQHFLYASGANNIYIAVATISGTSVTASTNAVSASSASNTRIKSFQHSATALNLVYQASATTYAITNVAVSGNTPGFGTPSTVTVSQSSPVFKALRVSGSNGTTGDALAIFLTSSASNNNSAVYRLVISSAPGIVATSGSSTITNGHSQGSVYLAANNNYVFTGLAQNVSGTNNYTKVNASSFAAEGVATIFTQDGTLIKKNLFSYYTSGVPNRLLSIGVDITGKQVSVRQADNTTGLVVSEAGYELSLPCIYNGTTIVETSFGLPHDSTSDCTLSPFTLVKGNTVAGFTPIKFLSAASVGDVYDNRAYAPLKNVIFNLADNSATVEDSLFLVKTTNLMNLQTNSIITSVIFASKGIDAAKSWVLDATSAQHVRITQVELGAI